jgi:dCTP diphosphatase
LDKYAIFTSTFKNPMLSIESQNNTMNELEEIKHLIRKFRDERDWMQFHNPKNLACSISIEAAELLELFQWKTPQESENLSKETKEKISNEMADIAVYLIELSDNLGINILEAIKTKMVANALKYPVSKAKGSALKYTEFK